MLNILPLLFVIICSLISAGFGLRCLSCDATTEPWLCTNAQTCQTNENKCAVYQGLVSGRLIYTSKCIPADECREGSIIFGKRQTQNSLKLCVPSCCDVDLCNVNCNGSAVTPSTSTVNHLTVPTTATTLNPGPTDKEFLLMYPEFKYSDSLYVLVAADLPGELEVEVPFLSMKRTIQLIIGRNYLEFNNTLRIRSGGTGVEHKGIYLKSNVHVSVFGITDYIRDSNETSSSYQYTEGFMVLPVSQLGNHYRVIQGHAYEELISIAALYDNTDIQVHFQVHDAFTSVHIGGHSFRNGGIYNVTLNRLDTLGVLHRYIMGTTTRSNKPIAMIGGDYYGYYGAPNVVYETPVESAGTTFLVPPIPETSEYYIRVLLAQDGDHAIANVTSRKGSKQYRISYNNVDMFFTNDDSGPMLIQSTRPLIVTVYSYDNSTVPTALIWIPSISHYKNSYTILNPTSITPYDFDVSAAIVIPTTNITDLLLDHLQIRSNKVHPTLMVNSTQYSFLAVAMDNMYQIVYHIDPSVTFGLFVFGKSRWEQYWGQSLFAFPGGFE